MLGQISEVVSLPTGQLTELQLDLLTLPDSPWAHPITKTYQNTFIMSSGHHFCLLFVL